MSKVLMGIVAGIVAGVLVLVAMAALEFLVKAFAEEYGVNLWVLVGLPALLVGVGVVESAIAVSSR